MRLLIIIAAFWATASAEYCIQYSSSNGVGTTTGYLNCDSGCCGTASNRYCCDSLGVGSIAGISVGGVVGLVIFFVLCYWFCSCCKGIPISP